MATVLGVLTNHMGWVCFAFLILKTTHTTQGGTVSGWGHEYRLQCHEVCAGDACVDGVVYFALCLVGDSVCC